MQATDIILENNIDKLLNKASEKFQVEFENVRVGSHKMHILQIADLDRYIDQLAEESRDKIELPFWAKIWPASILLSHYLTSFPEPAAGRQVIELGCGIGLAGLFCAARGFDVVLSDNNTDALLFAKINILKNNLQKKVSIMPVDFTRDRLQKKFDYIVGSEIFYRESGYRGLVKFLLFHLQTSPHAEVVLSADYRRQAKKFFQTARKEFYIDQKNIGYKEQEDQSGDQERFLCAIYRMKAIKK